MTEQGVPARIQIVSTELVSLDFTKGEQLTNPGAVAPVLLQLIGRKDREHFVTLHLDARNRVVSVETISIGSLVASLVHPREVFKGAILQNAAGIICGHNHPSGDLGPSREDQAIFARLRSAGDIIGINLVDFLIVSDSAFIAFSELGEEGNHAACSPSVERSRVAD